MEGTNWGDVRQKDTNKVERQSVRDGYETGHGLRGRILTRLEYVRNVDIERGTCVGLPDDMTPQIEERSQF